MLYYYLFQRELTEGYFEVGVIAKTLDDAKKYLSTRYSNASKFDMVFYKPAEGMFFVL